MAVHTYIAYAMDIMTIGHMCFTQYNDDMALKTKLQEYSELTQKMSNIVRIQIVRKRMRIHGSKQSFTP